MGLEKERDQDESGWRMGGIGRDWERKLLGKFELHDNWDPYTMKRMKGKDRGETSSKTCCMASSQDAMFVGTREQTLAAIVSHALVWRQN